MRASLLRPPPAVEEGCPQTAKIGCSRTPPEQAAVHRRPAALATRSSAAVHSSPRRRRPKQQAARSDQASHGTTRASHCSDEADAKARRHPNRWNHRSGGTAIQDHRCCCCCCRWQRHRSAAPHPQGTNARRASRSWSSAAVTKRTSTDQSLRCLHCCRAQKHRAASRAATSANPTGLALRPLQRRRRAQRAATLRCACGDAYRCLRAAQRAQHPKPQQPPKHLAPPRLPPSSSLAWTCDWHPSSPRRYRRS